MKAERPLKADRPLARHCPQLFGQPANSGNLAQRLPAIAERLADGLTTELEGLLGGVRLAIAQAPLETLPLSSLRKKAGKLPASFLLRAEVPGVQVMGLMSLAHAMSFTDLLFGGTGHLPGDLPVRIPSAISLSMTRLGQAVAACLSAGFHHAFELQNGTANDALPDAGNEHEEMHVLKLSIVAQGGPEWLLMLAIPLSGLAALFSDSPAPPPTRTGRPNEMLPAIPLELRALLAEFTMPLARVSAWKPGDVLALAVPREVPLYSDQIAIAHGRPGGSDGRFSLQITHTAWTERKNHDD